MRYNKNGIDIKAIGRLLRRYLTLNIDNFRLSFTERLTLLMTAVAFSLVALFFCTVGFIFLTASIANMLEGHLAIKWVYMIVSGIYFATVVLLWLLRKPLIMNPICRFLSRLILEPPTKTN